MATPSAQAIPVLVVDDDEGFLRVASSVLADPPPDFAVSTVRSGTEAVAFLERRPPFADAPRPAFVILDLRLPDMDAPEVLARLAADGTLGDLPVLVVSQADWAEDEAALRRAGATEFRTKPSRLSTLRDIVIDFWRAHVRPRLQARHERHPRRAPRQRGAHHARHDLGRRPSPHPRHPLHAAGVITFSPVVAATGVVLLALPAGRPAWWSAATSARHLWSPSTSLHRWHHRHQPRPREHPLPGATLFYALLVANSGFSAPVRYLFANLSAAAYAALLGAEQFGVLPRAAGAFPAGLVPVPPWSAQLAFLALLAASLNLLAVITQRLIDLLDWSRQRLAHVNLELEGWRQSLADQVRERTRELEVANRELDARARALQERSHRLRTFVYTVTHDLKTPVNNVVLLCDLMLARDGGRLGDEGRHDLERIAGLAGRTEHMIRDLFALFQITSAQEEPRWVALDQVAQSAVDDLAPQIAAKHITSGSTRCRASGVRSG